MMNAQQLYDAREESGFTAGKKLHNFFSEQTGDPSPAGRVEIDNAAAKSFYAAEVATRVAHGCKAEEFPPLE